MKLIESSVEIIPQENGLEGIYKQIERAGRLCYKSEDKICEGSAEKMVNFLKNKGHGSPLEAGTVYLKIPANIDVAADFLDDNFVWTKCHLVQEKTGNWWAVTTNYRRIVELHYENYLQYLCEPTEYHEKRITIKFTLSRSIANEFVRHRVFSFCQESQRYCSYNLGKYNGEITFIIPEWVKDIMNDIASSIDWTTGQTQDYILQMPMSETVRLHGSVLSRAVNCWIDAMKRSEDDYMYLITQEELKPQEARSVLPNDCKTELIMTGFASDWQHFLSLRAAQGAHPDARILANDLRYLLEINGLINCTKNEN